MRSFRYLFLIIVLFSSACSGTAPTITTSTVQSVVKPVKLPPTWTQTPSSIPSQTPVHTPTLTFTPFPSVTPLPATLTLGPTSNVPTITSTSTITPTLDTSCNITVQGEEGITVHSAPVSNPYRVLPALSPGNTYQGVQVFPPFIELELNEQLVGWIDLRSQNLEAQGAGCDQLPTDTRELTDFQSLCFFAPEGEIETYSDRSLLEPYETITPTQSFILDLQYTDVFYTSGGESDAGFFVRADQVSTFGACENTPYVGITTTDNWLWSEPNGEIGQHVEALRPAQRIFIQEGPIKGPSPPDVSTDGGWYFVLLSPYNDGITGWVWSSFIFIE